MGLFPFAKFAQAFGGSSEDPTSSFGHGVVRCVFATHELDTGYTGTESEFAQGVITVPDVCAVQDC
jgi:hypothetical protein